MGLKIYNTLTRSLQDFTPLNPPKVSIYACGITVYDQAHIGHASQAIIFDVIRKYLTYKGYDVTYVRNFTDVDDKIIARAQSEGKSAAELSSYFIAQTNADLRALKIDDADFQPCVSNHIQEIISFIADLMAQGYAYASLGDVLFRVASFSGYGKLSNRKTADLQASEDSSKKESPHDFALWKAAKPGEPCWESPWGKGRPGWHIECSVMAEHFLGPQLDIHGGGTDLIFPHHENEIAQSESRHKRSFARYWMHNGLVMVNNQKMSKSLGNFYTVKQALAQFPPDVIRYVILSYQYSSNIDFSEQSFSNAMKRIIYFYRTLSQAQAMSSPTPTPADPTRQVFKFKADFEAAMDENFNTPRVMAALAQHFSRLNEVISDKSLNTAQKAQLCSEAVAQLKPVQQVLRILDEDPQTFLENITSLILAERGITRQEIESLIRERSAAKQQRDFALADRLRDQLKAMKIKLLDSPSGTIWEIACD